VIGFGKGWHRMLRQCRRVCASCSIVLPRLDGEAPSIVPELEGDRPRRTDLKHHFTRRWRWF